MLTHLTEDHRGKLAKKYNNRLNKVEYLLSPYVLPYCSTNKQRNPDKDLSIPLTPNPIFKRQLYDID